MRAALPVLALTALVTLGASAEAQRVVERPAEPAGVSGVGAAAGGGMGTTLQSGGLNGTIHTFNAPTSSNGDDQGCCTADGTGESGTTDTATADDVVADRAADRAVDTLIARLPLVGKLRRYE